ncbi:MAG: ribosome-associated translation inhibitor RaiA [Candidatus Komeilibacteria bacterium]|nr:ribosome-associated translation inhibitor RaiA [Candidatus Komeilibacteria bacterium]
MKIIIKSTNFSLSEDNKKLITEKIGDVDKFFPNIIEARVEVEFDDNKRGGDKFRCEVNLSVPGRLIRVEKATDDFEKSVNKVKDHLKVVLAKERGKQLSLKKAQIK